VKGDKILRNNKKISIFIAILICVTAFFGYIPAKGIVQANKPEVDFLGVEHSPLVVGDTETFSIVTKNAINVQYNVVLKDAKGNIVENLTNGYTETVPANIPFELAAKYVFQRGSYTLDITVKRSEDGVTNTYKATLNCVNRDDKNRVYANGNMDIEKTIYRPGEKVVINGVKDLSGIQGPYVYRLHIYNTKTNKWTKNLIKNYGDKLEWTPTEAGVYVLDVHINTGKSTTWAKYLTNPSSDNLYGTYEAWKLKVITVEEDEMKVIKVTPSNN
jgi:hypothetical protein